MKNRDKLLKELKEKKLDTLTKIADKYCELNNIKTNVQPSESYILGKNGKKIKPTKLEDRLPDKD